MNSIGKIVLRVREKFPETNSSSSHSVSINLLKRYYSLEELNLTINDGTIYIPDHKDDFGWEYKKYNDALTKIQYVSSIPEIKTNQKKVKMLKNIITSFTGAKEVIFEWEKNFYDQLSQFKENSFNYSEEILYFGSSIDHNSSTVFSQILENRNTIKDFIFSPDSWLFLGNDNSLPPENFFSTGNTKPSPEAIVSIDFGGSIGIIDFEVPEFPSKTDLINDVISNPISLAILESIRIDKSTGESVKYTDTDLYRCQNRFENYKDIMKETSKYLKLFTSISHLCNLPNIYYVSDEFKSEFFKKRDRTKSMKDEFLSLIENYSSPADYKAFPISLITKEFGKLI